MNRIEKDMNVVEETDRPEAADAEAPAADPVEQNAHGDDATAEVESSGGAAAPETSGPSAEELTEELRTVQDRLMRQAAEFQNYRRRTDQEKSRMVSFGKAMVVQQLLDVVDDFERSLEAARAVEGDADQKNAKKAFTALRDGVELVYAKLRDELAKVGVEEIDAVGKPFDEEAHEALMRQPAAEGQEPGIVVGEIQKGYRMDDRVLRHAKVIVSA